MAALPLVERKVRTPQDKAPLKRRTPPWWGWQVQQKVYILTLCQEIGEMVV